MVKNTCSFENCSELNLRLYGGRPFCSTHYKEKLLKDLYRRHAGWNTDATAPANFKYQLGRFYEDYSKTTLNSYLSAARIRNRGFDFKKTDEGCQFSITRHLNAWNADKRMTRVVELWQAELSKFEFTLISTREWTPSDPE